MVFLFALTAGGSGSSEGAHISNGRPRIDLGGYMNSYNRAHQGGFAHDPGRMKQGVDRDTEHAEEGMYGQRTRGTSRSIRTQHGAHKMSMTQSTPRNMLCD